MDEGRARGDSVTGGRTVRVLSVFLVGLLCLPAEALAQKHKDVENIGQRDINRGSWNLYPIEKEIELGRQLASDVEAHSRPYPDPRVQAYVNDLVQHLVRNSDAHIPFTVKVIDSDEVNAFALPGGFLYVNTGLILEAESEAELAGLLAHEIAHVTARHGTKQASKATLFQIFTLPLIFVGGPVGYAIQGAVGLAVPLTFLKFSRNAEREADFLGLQYTYRAGYDPVALVDFLERLKDKDREGGMAKVFSTHPMTTDRIQRAQKGIAEVLRPQPEYVVTTSRFDEIKALILSQQQANGLAGSPGSRGPHLRIRTQEGEDRRR